jgi:hypothetical protein
MTVKTAMSSGVLTRVNLIAVVRLGSLLGTGGATISRYLAGEGRQCAAFPLTPTPADKMPTKKQTTDDERLQR